MERLFAAVRNLGRRSGVRDAFHWIGFNMTKYRKSDKHCELSCHGYQSVIRNHRCLHLSEKISWNQISIVIDAFFVCGGRRPTRCQIRVTCLELCCRKLLGMVSGSPKVPPGSEID